jgi:hypothetical protein
VRSTFEKRVAITGVPTGGDELRGNWPWFVLLGVALTATGRVHSWADRDEAGSAAWSAPGVTDVENDLIVSG